MHGLDSSHAHAALERNSSDVASIISARPSTDALRLTGCSFTLAFRGVALTALPFGVEAAFGVDGVPFGVYVPFGVSCDPFGVAPPCLPTFRSEGAEDDFDAAFAVFSAGRFVPPSGWGMGVGGPCNEELCAGSLQPTAISGQL